MSTPAHGPADDSTDPGASPRGSRFRQLLHWATGDREAEARALADASPEEVTVDDARAAVDQAHGEAPSAQERDPEASDVAEVADAIAVHEAG